MVTKKANKVVIAVPGGDVNGVIARRTSHGPEDPLRRDHVASNLLNRFPSNTPANSLLNKMSVSLNPSNSLGFRSM